MVPKNQKRIILCAAALLLAVLPLSGQPGGSQTDSLVRLLNARYLEQVETDGRMARKAIDATFLHNGTYLSCDTALWHVEEKLINCFGNVQLMQGESVLTSDKLDYLIDESLAQFRGSVVQLRNKQDNILRTRSLDYYTQDSLAIFQGGASMISEDGQIIESDEGTYRNATDFFTFSGNVNMFTDSVFVKTERLTYDSKTARADFLADIDFWKDDNMLSAGGGWYERDDDIFFFRHRVHGLGSTEESWSDSLYYYRGPNNLLMLGNVQVQDQNRKVAAMGDRLQYVDSLSRVTLRNRASAALWDGTGEHADTTYLGATYFEYDTRRKCDIPETEVKEAAGRLEEMLGDPVAEYRRRAAQQAAEAAAQALKEDPNARAQAQAQAQRRGGEPPRIEGPRGISGEPDPGAVSPRGGDSPITSANDEESLTARESERSDAGGSGGTPPDNEASACEAGVIGESPDSLAVVPPPDTTKIGFLLAHGDVRIFRKDMQVRCDSLRYSDLDSIARFYKDPVVWNEPHRQYNSDSLFVLIRDNKMERANLLSNAFIHTEEPGGYYDQIKSTDVIAYFSDSTSLRRFDALGGVTAILYLEENDAIATVNKTETRMMMAIFDDEGQIDHVYNFDNPKSDVYPVVQFPVSDRKLRGFRWDPDRRPKDKFDVTAMVVKDSEREAYEARPRTTFSRTELYFPGHMEDVYRAIEDARIRRESRPGDSPVKPENDRGVANDGGVLNDGLDSLSVARDSLAVIEDGLSEATSASADRPGPGTLTEEESERDLRDAGGPGDMPPSYMSDRELRRALRIARRDARWEELDARDADKAAQKQARREARQARREAKREAREARQAAIDAAKLKKYIERYQKQKERYEGKQEPEPAGERPPGIEGGREVPPVVETD